MLDLGWGSEPSGTPGISRGEAGNRGDQEGAAGEEGEDSGTEGPGWGRVGQYHHTGQGKQRAVEGTPSPQRGSLRRAGLMAADSMTQSS